MRSGSIIAIVLIVIVIIVGLSMWGNRAANGPDNNVNVTVSPTPTPTSTATSTPTPTATSTPTATATPTASVPKTVTVNYTDSGFSPSSVTIKRGDTVTFTNNSTRTFWPASDDHPSHLKYPEFDPKQALNTGSSWSFVFNKTGTWNYHDHRRAANVGTVIVQ